MNNLAQKQNDAKQARLNRQAARMFVIYQNAVKTERSAILRQIDSFLKAVSKDEKIFWLKFLGKLEKLKEQSGSKN